MTHDFLSPDRAVAHEGAVPPARSPLHEKARQAGARFVVRHGWEVAASYGPVAAEIAACQASAGIADRSHFGKLELQAPPDVLAACVAGRTDAPLTLGMARDDGAAWWCPLTEDRAMVLATRAPVGELRERLEEELAVEGGAVVDVTTGFAAVALAGPRARDILARVTAIDVRPQSLPECGFRPGSVARVPGMLLRERGDRLLVLCGSAHAEYIWLALSDAGRPLGAAHVGVDALERLDAVPARGLTHA
jgi:heterotetrameric sarcosine oxidase gamma subunit